MVRSRGGRGGRGRGGGAPRGGRGGSRGGGGGGPALRSASLKGPAPFSLRDEASHTGARPRSFWTGDTKLRHLPVSFVPSGQLDGTRDEEISVEMAEELEAMHSDEESAAAPTTHSPNASRTILLSHADAVDTPHSPLSRLSLRTESSSQPAVTHIEAPSAEGGAAQLQKPTTAAPVATSSDESANVEASQSSDSEEEIVVFKGRIPQQSTAASKLPAPAPAKPIVPQKAAPSSSEAAPTTAGSQPAPSAVSKKTSISQSITPQNPRSQSKTRDFLHSRPKASMVNQAEQSVDTKPSWDVGSTPWEHRSKPNIGWSRDYVIADEQRRAKRAAKEQKQLAERTQKLLEQQEEDAIMADYIANMEAQAEDEPFKLQPRALGLDDGMDVELGDLLDQTVYVEQHGAWDETMLKAFDEASTSDDILADVEHVVGRRKRKSGFQYLVVYEDSTIDEARWLPETFLKRKAELALIESFNRAQAEIAAAMALNEDASSSDSDDSDYSDVDDSEISSGDDEAAFKDEEDLIQRRKDRLTDEQIARMLAKQESLGIGGDDLQVFDGEFAGLEEDDDDDFGTNDPTFQFASFTSTKTGGGKKKSKGKKKQGFFPNATLFADVIEQDPYNGFDIMDFERPSLRPRKKGRRGRLELDISDEELGAQMKSQWEADRKKKAVKKAERQELRAKGLLGKKNKFKLDTEALLGEAMPWHEIRDTIVSFLVSSDDSFTFPPGLSKSDRAFVHDVANLFLLKSSSKGNDKANNRRITIERVPRSIASQSPEFNLIARRVNQRFFLGDGITPNRGALRGGKVRGKAGGNRDMLAERGEYSKTTYKSGEVIGSKASEIGIENRGRAMLEKMGWSKGQALGAENNPGLLDPIQHIFKTGKAGLR